MDKSLDNDKPHKIKEFYDFGDYRLDVEARRLWRGEELVALTPKEFEVLFYLVSRAGRVVEKGELLDAIWADTFVEETTLARNVSWLRKKLGDGADGKKYIETVPKRGYRFAAEVVKAQSENSLVRQSDASSDEEAEIGALVIEEQTVQRFLVAETITISPADATKNLSPAAPVNLQFKPISESRQPKLPHVFFGILAAIVISLLAYQFYFRPPGQKIVAVSKVAAFSGLPGREDMPAFSPDGKMLAFAWNGDDVNNLDIYVKLVGAGEPVRLTKNDADDMRPTFSPDGKQIAFVRVLPTRSELLVIPALGGAERKICDLRRNLSGVSFSPDGLFLAVNDGDDARGERAGIFLVSVETGEKRRLTSPPELADDDCPAFAPDGKSILFIRNFGQVVQEIFIAAAGGEPRQLTSDQSWIGGATWTADGQKIIFASRRKYNNQPNLWQIAAFNGDAPELLATGSRRIANPAVSADGRTIAFVEESYDTNIWRLEPARLPARDAWRKFAPSSFNDNSPNVAPDGKQIVFASSRTGNYEIWIADADGGNVRQLTDFRTSPVGSPRFSPDGRQIVFDAQVGGNGDIYAIAAGGGAPRRLTDAGAFDYMPAWSADGNSIFFASDRSGAAQIYKMSANGGEAVQITQNGGRESFASPDGKTLYYAKGEGTAGLWRVSLKDGGEQMISELAEAGTWRYWTLTEKGIYFVRRAESPPYKIMFYDFAAAQVKEAAETENAPIWVYPGLGASADGKMIFYTRFEQNASSIMLTEIGK